MNHKKSKKNNNILPEKNIDNEISRNRRLTQISLFLLVLGVVLIYIFSFLKFLNIWEVKGFTDLSGFNRDFRFIFIFIIIGTFLTSLLIMMLMNSKIKKSDKDIGLKTIIIHDDVIQVPKINHINQINQNNLKRENKQDLYDSMLKSIKYYEIDHLFSRKGSFGAFLKISNYISLIALILVLYIFLIWPNMGFIYTIEGHIMMDVSMTWLLIYFLFRCPDFVKSLAASGFKRLNMRKIHIHESLIGLLLAIGGIMLIMNGAGDGAYFERMTGIIVITLGIFMLGRDWKDFTMGNFINDKNIPKTSE